MDIHYPAVFEAQEPSGFFVRFVDVPEAITQGQTLDECELAAAEVLSLVLDDYIEEGRPIPAPTQEVAEAHYIAPDAKTQAALLVRIARDGKSLADLARALGTSWPSAQRLEDPRHWPSLKTLDRAAAALGKRLVLRFE